MERGKFGTGQVVTEWRNEDWALSPQPVHLQMPCPPPHPQETQACCSPLGTFALSDLLGIGRPLP